MTQIFTVCEAKKLSVWLIFIVYKQTDKYYVAKYLYGLQIRHLDYVCAKFQVHFKALHYKYLSKEKL
jgi:hypothetical protein